MRATLVWATGLGSTLIVNNFHLLAVIGLLSLSYHFIVDGRSAMKRLALSFCSAGLVLSLLVMLAAHTNFAGALTPAEPLLFVVARVVISASWTMGWAAQLNPVELRRQLHQNSWCQPIAELLDMLIFHGSILARQWGERHQAAMVRGANWRSPAAVWTMGRILAQGALVSLDQSVRREESRALRCAAAGDEDQQDSLTNTPVPTLKLEDLTLGYGQHPCVLRNISFDAAPGEWIVIAGASGSGKSTLMKGVAGLLPRTEGLLHRFGHIVPAGAGQLDGRISLVFQNPNHQFLGATPRDDLRWGLRQRGIPTHQAEQRITAIFHQLQITELADQPLHELSLGQRRLVALSAALSTLPDLLLCDELTNGLDPVNAHRVLTAVEAARTTGTTVIWVTHELHRLPAAAHRVLLMREGSLIFDGPRHLGLRPENLQKTGLWVAPRDYQNTYHNHFDEPDFNHDTPRGD